MTPARAAISATVRPSAKRALSRSARSRVKTDGRPGGPSRGPGSDAAGGPQLVRLHGICCQQRGEARRKWPERRQAPGRGLLGFLLGHEARSTEGLGAFPPGRPRPARSSPVAAEGSLKPSGCARSRHRRTRPGTRRGGPWPIREFACSRPRRPAPRSRRRRRDNRVAAFLPLASWRLIPQAGPGPARVRRMAQRSKFPESPVLGSCRRIVGAPRGDLWPLDVPGWPWGASPAPVSHPAYGDVGKAALGPGRANPPWQRSSGPPHPGPLPETPCNGRAVPRRRPRDPGPCRRAESGRERPDRGPPFARCREPASRCAERTVPFAFRVWHTYGQIVRAPKANGTPTPTPAPRPTAEEIVLDTVTPSPRAMLFAAWGWPQTLAFDEIAVTVDIHNDIEYPRDDGLHVIGCTPFRIGGKVAYFGLQTDVNTGTRGRVEAHRQEGYLLNLGCSGP